MAALVAQAQQELDALEAALRDVLFDDNALFQRLSRLKVLARNPANAPCVYKAEGLKVLADIAFLEGSTQGQGEKSSLEAGRIIANALLLQDRTQQIFADLGIIDRLLRFYQQDTADHEFVGGRILFLLTYNSDVDFEHHVKNGQLLDQIEAHLLKHASQISAGYYASGTMQEMALIETLKLLYNIATKCEALNDRFTKLVPLLVRVASDVALPSKPLDPPITQLLNALAVIDWPSSLTFVASVSQGAEVFGNRLVDIVDKSISSLPVSQLESVLIVPLTVLRQIAMLAYQPTKSLLRSKLLPKDEERDQPLGNSQTLASRLLQLQGTAGVMVLPEAISGLLFELSDRDASEFVHNIGYGHAAGYLMTHQIPVPEGLTTNTNGVPQARSGLDINPVTGQRLDAEPTGPQSEMTDEEKEKEAERLFVLFERLRATGVVNVENPLTAAQQSGRLEELSDSEPD